jgi:hypothetical protein
LVDSFRRSSNRDRYLGWNSAKKEIGGTQETTGFQREEDKKRIKELVNFYSNDSNVIQNPLLCATRQTKRGVVQFAQDINTNGEY